jgi:hypothetical protein
LRISVAIAVALGLPLSPAIRPPDVSAHCPGTADWKTVAGAREPGVSINGVAADIQWVQGNVCTNGGSHSISVVTATGRWVQAGFRYYFGYAEPKGYCELSGTTYKLIEFSISHTTHRYKFTYNTVGVEHFWVCYSDNVSKWSYDVADAGFSSGNRGQAQGEAHQTHVQIGKAAPARLLFSDMLYRRAIDSQWPALDIVIQPFFDPYDAAEPAVGQMQVWTNPH